MPKLNDILNQKISDQNDVRLEVDLIEMFGQSVPDSTAFRQSVGQAIIDKIRDRTENNQFMNNAKQTYSEDYVESTAFKAYGKSKSDVNLTQTGDMLGLLDIVEETENKIVLGWTDSLQSNKAHGHITGNVGAKRNFLGVPAAELKSIASKFKDELPSDDETSRSSVSLTQQFLTGTNSGQSAGSQTLGRIINIFLGEDEGDL